MKILSVENALALHALLSAETGGDPGLRDIALLEAALAAPLASFGGEDLYKTAEEKAARLAHSLIANHPFVDGNKRIGMLALFVFLEANGIALRPTNAELARVGIAVASGAMKCADLLDWILENKN